MLNDEISKKICELVKLKPRSMQEISQHINKNWRTAERYVEKLEGETGMISTRIFREGTRGALKIVFWNSVEDIHSVSFQKDIYEDIMNVKKKIDFSPFEIFQHVDKNKKKVYVEDVSKIDPELEITKKQDLAGALRKAKKEVLVFSGNLSWINAHQGDIQMIDVLREITKKGVIIKVIARVSLIGIDNVKKLLNLNKELGKDVVEIRHRYQPLRAIIIDDSIIKLRELKHPEYYPENELKKKIEIFYDIYDKEWVVWCQKVFWKMFSISIHAQKRVEEIKEIEKVIGL